MSTTRPAVGSQLDGLRIDIDGEPRHVLHKEIQRRAAFHCKARRLKYRGRDSQQ
jgi:hypothetical protein